MLLSCWGSQQKTLWCALCARVCAVTQNSIWKYLMCMGMPQLQRTILNKTRTAQVIHQQEKATQWEYCVATHLEKQNSLLLVKDPVNFPVCPLLISDLIACPCKSGFSPTDGWLLCRASALPVQVCSCAAGLGASLDCVCVSWQSKRTQRFYQGL